MIDSVFNNVTRNNKKQKEGKKYYGIQDLATTTGVLLTATIAVV
jgi:hypothetical protein